MERLADAVEQAVASDERGWANQVSAGLRAGLDFLAADPPLAHLLLVESLAAARPARLEHERSLERLAEALRPPAAESGLEQSPRRPRACSPAASPRMSRVACSPARRSGCPSCTTPLLQYLLAPVAGGFAHRG